MHSILSYIIAGGVGVLIAHLISRPPELRTMRLSQLIFIPIGFVLCSHLAGGGIAELMCFLVVLGCLIVLMVPNIAYLFGASLSGLIDPQDWTSTEEEVALRPIHKLIDKDQYGQALTDLDELLKEHKPTYEALLIKAKLLHHLGSVDETVATLLKSIGLTHSTPQQLAVMELLAEMEGQHLDPASPFVPGTRTIEINHELVLFLMDDETPVLRKEIAPGTYKVQEALHRNHRWLRLEGENWGNAEMCWQAVVAETHAPTPPQRGFLVRIARMHQAIDNAIKRKKPRRFQQAEAKELFKEASQLIRRHEWQRAVPLLQKASACDPDHYEIAFRWVQAVRFTASDAETEQAINQVLKQSRWSEHEEQMIRELRRPVSR